MALAYLTLQDVQLLHFMLTKERSAFDALRLEEAVFYQYAPGGGADLARQGSRFPRSRSIDTDASEEP